MKKTFLIFVLSMIIQAQFLPTMIVVAETTEETSAKEGVEETASGSELEEQKLATNSVGVSEETIIDGPLNQGRQQSEEKSARFSSSEQMIFEATDILETRNTAEIELLKNRTFAVGSTGTTRIPDWEIVLAPNPIAGNLERDRTLTYVRDEWNQSGGTTQIYLVTGIGYEFELGYRNGVLSEITRTTGSIGGRQLILSQTIATTPGFTYILRLMGTFVATVYDGDRVVAGAGAILSTTIDASSTIQELEFVAKSSQTTVGFRFTGSPTSSISLNQMHVPVRSVAVENDIGSEGTAVVESTAVVQGSSTELRASANQGYRFVRWEIVSGEGSIESPLLANTNLAVTTTDVVVRPVFEKLLTINGVKTDSWHKDEAIPLFILDYYNEHVSNQVITIPNMANYFSNISVVAKDQEGNIVNNFPVTASGDCLQIWNYSGDLSLGQLTIEVSGKVKSIEGVEISNTNYFDFGQFSATSSLANGTFLAEAESEQSVLAKASMLTVNHLSEVGEYMADSIITYEMPGVSYETTALDFDGYRVKEVIGEAVGEHTTAAPIEVTYIYEEIPGILEIQKVSYLDFEFGNVKQSSRSQTVSAIGEEAPTITISDYSDATQWQLYASVSPFRNETNKELKGAEITLKDLKIVESVHSWLWIPSRDVLLSTTPQLIGVMTNPNGIYENEHGQTIIQIGEAKNDSLTGVSLNLPANTAMDPGAYQATITWELVGDPTIGGSR